ncbi:MAG TPA: GEVED domain-containing protein [Verrucomicrobiae bacterium]|nr:GEVED domain-containing protein [Verrucomicrobiae bacterium]
MRGKVKLSRLERNTSHGELTGLRIGQRRIWGLVLSFAAIALIISSTILITKFVDVQAQGGVGTQPAGTNAGIVGENRSGTTLFSCPAGTVFTGAKHIDKSLSSPNSTTRGMTTNIGLYCSRITTNGTTVTLTRTTAAGTPAVTGIAYALGGGVQNGYCPAGQAVQQMGGWDRFAGTGEQWTSAIRIVCRPLILNANDWIRVNTATGANVDVGARETNLAAHTYRGPFCANTATTLVSGYVLQGGGEGYDGIAIRCGTIEQARFSSVMLFSDFAWSKTLGGTGWKMNLNQGTALINAGGWSGAGKTPHASTAANTNIFHAPNEVYVEPGTNYRAAISQRPTGIATNTYVATGNCLTGLTLANEQDAACSMTITGRPDIAVSMTMPTSPYTLYGQSQTVRLTATNKGPGATDTNDGFTLVATLPSGWTAGATLPANCTANTARTIVTCVLNPTPLAAAASPGANGGTVSFNIPVIVNSPTAPGSYNASLALGRTVPDGDTDATNNDFSTANDRATGALVYTLPGTLVLHKVTTGSAGGPFGFTLTNTTQTTGTATTTEAGTSVDVDGNSGTAGVQPFTIGTLNTDVTITESALPAGWSVSDITCVNSSDVAVGSRSGNTYTIPGSQVVSGQAFDCTYTNAPTTDLAINKDDGNTTFTPGTDVTYSIIVSNNGPLNVEDALVTDDLPAGIDDASWMCGNAIGGGICDQPSGIGPLSEIVDLPVGASVTYTFTVPVPETFTGNLVNTATVAPPEGITDSTTENNSDTDTDTPPPTTIVLNKVTNDVEGGPFDFTLTNTTQTTGAVTTTEGNSPTQVDGDTGSAGVQAFTVSDTDADVTIAEASSSNWTLESFICTDRNGTIVGSLSGNTYTITAAEIATSLAFDCEVVNAPTPATLTLNKVTTNGFGGPFGFTLVNTVQTDGTATTTAANSPVQVDGDAGTAGTQPYVVASFNEDITITESSLPAGWRLDGVSCISNGNPVGSLVGTTFTIPADEVDAAGENFACTFTNDVIQADLAITKDDGRTEYIPGDTVTYDVVVSNNGPFEALNASVTDPLPSGITAASWTCGDATLGASCGAPSGTGALNATVNLPIGSQVTYKITLTIPATRTGALTNTATVTPATGTIDPDTTDNSASDTDLQAPPIISLYKTTDGAAGGPFDFTLTNTSVSTASVTTTAANTPTQADSDPLVAGNQPFKVLDFNQDVVITESSLPSSWKLASFTCTNLAGSTVGSLAGNAYTIPSAALIASPSFSCTATNAPREVDLAINKDDGSATYSAGANTTYEIVVTNNGPDAVSNAVIVDNLPSGITTANWTCGNATGGGVCDQASGTGAINTTADLPVGASVMYTLTLSVPSSYAGTLSNTATVTAPTGVQESILDNNSDTDVDTQSPPPSSSACSVRNVGANFGTAFAYNPYTFTATANGTSMGWVGVAGNATIVDLAGIDHTTALVGQWNFGSRDSRTFTYTLTFSQPIPANLIALQIAHVGAATDAAYNPTITVTLSGTGTTANRADLRMAPGNGTLLYNNTTGVISKSVANFNPPENGLLVGNSTDLIRTITLTGSDFWPTDNGSIRLLTLPSCITVQKTSSPNTGTFTFNQTNVVNGTRAAVANTSLTTTAPNTPVSSAMQFAGTVGSNIVLSEVVPTGWNLSSAVCTDRNAAETGNPGTIGTLSGSTVTIPGANVRVASDIACLFTDTQNIDYGDAPSSYGTDSANNGANHATTAGLRLGAIVDTETNGQPSADAAADDTTSLADEDAVSGPIEITSGQPTTVNVSVTNTTAQPATLAGWLDLNNNGVFDAGERVVVSIPANSGTATYPVVFPAGTPTADTFARFRLFSGTVASPSPTGYAAGGEVEDYAARLLPATITLTKTTNGMGGGPFNFTLTNTTQASGSVTTSAAATPTQVDGNTSTAGTQPFTVASRTADVTITEASLPADWTLSNFTCTNASGSTVGSRSGSTYTITAAQITASSSFTCTVTNTPAPATIILNKTSNNGVGGPFNFTLTNTTQTSGAVTTTAQGTATQVDGDTATAGAQAFTIATFGQAVTITEADAPGWDLASIACTSNSFPVGSRSGRTFTIPASATTTPGGVITCTFTNEKLRADLAITKTDNKATYNPGTNNIYTIVATNNGPYPVTGASIIDTLPAGVTTASWTCGSPTGGGVCGAASGTGAINTTADLPVGATVTYTLTMAIPAGQTGDLTNRVNIIAPSTITEIDTTNNQAIDIDQLVRDFADAPASYGTGTTSHATLPGLTIGSNITFESTAPVSADAGADSADDGLASPIVITPGVSSTVTISATNTTSEPATLAGWIDLNGDGVFEASERVVVTIPANSGTADYALIFPAGTVTADTFARFRLLSGAVANPSPVGQVIGGEVEDYPVQIARVQYRKAVTPAPIGPLTPGQTFTYSITAENVGTTPLTGLTITDDMTQVIDDATYNNDATATSGSVSYAAPNLSWTGDLVPGGTMTITYTVTTNNPITGDAVLFNNIIGTGPASNCTALTTTSDPACFVRIPQPNVTSIKTLVSPTNPKAGDVVTYRFTVANNGGAAAGGVIIGDSLAGVLDDATYNAGSETADIGSATYNATSQQITWTGNLAAAGSAGDTATIEYTVTLNGPEDLGDGILENGLIAPGCPNPPIYDPAHPDYDPDCVTVTPVEAWVARKTVSPTGNAQPGDSLTYSVTVENTGQTDLTGVSVADNLTDDLDDATYNNNPSPATGVSYAAPTLSWTGDLQVSETHTFSYTMTVKAADALGNGNMVNSITGSPNCPSPAITDPVDPAFNPDCVTITPIEAWTVVKTSDATGVVEAGDVVTYTLTIENTGSANLSGISTSDNLSGVLDDATFNNDQAASIGVPIYAVPTLTWTGNLNVGQTATVTYSVTVNPASAAGDGALRNAVVGGQCPDPAITDPTDPNYNPDCITIIPVKEWISTKTATPASGTVRLPGQVVNYTIIVENTGTANLTGADAPAVSDDLSAALDDSTFNNDQTATIGTPAYAAPTLSWSNDLNVGQVSTISYSVTINDLDNLGDGALRNAITGSPNCPDPAITNPADPNYNPDCVTIHPIEAWKVIKTSAATGAVTAGDTVGYTLTIENLGSVPLSGKSVSDNLGGVLDDATYNNDANSGGIGSVSFAAPTLTWTGNIAVGQTVTVSYSVTVNPASAAGDGALRNAVVGGQCPNPAITNPSDPNFNPDCVSIIPIKEWIGIKKATPTGSLKPGATVTYTLTIRNTGTANLTGADAPAIEDDLTEVIDDAAYNNDVTATLGTPAYTAPLLTWSNDLNVGQTATIKYSVTTNAAGDFNDGMLVNALSGPPNCTVAMAAPFAAAADTDCSTTRYIENFEMTKTANPADSSKVKPGDTITYTVTIRNTGAVDLTAFTFDDKLDQVLNHATFVGSPNVDGPGLAVRNNNLLTYTGDIPIGQSVTVSYAVRVNQDAPLDAVLRNVVTGPFSNCFTGEEPECLTTHTVVSPSPIPALPNTGMNLLLPIGAAALLIGTGLYIRKRKQA